MLYDADCAFCTASVRAAEGRWFGARIDACPYQTTDLTVHKLAVDKCAAALNVVAPDGRVVVGADAVAAVLRAAHQPWPVVGRVLSLPGVRRLAQAGYRLVSRNRHRLPGGTAACELP